MIAEVDESLCALLAAALPDGTAVGIDRAGGGVSVVLRAIREETAGLPADWTDLRDERGTVIARRPPVHRFELRYTVRVSAESARAEHTMLDAILVAVHDGPAIGAEHLHASFVEAAMPVLIRLDDRETDGELPAELGLDLVITAPLLVPSTEQVAPAPEEITLGATAGRPRPARPAPPPPSLRGKRIHEGG